MNKNIVEGLICVRCNKDIVYTQCWAESQSIICHSCLTSYPIIDRIPVILNEEKSIFKNVDFIKRKNLFFDISKGGKLKKVFSILVPSNAANWVAKKNYGIIANMLQQKNQTPSKVKVLVIGGSIEGQGVKDFLKNPNFVTIESDVSFGEKTQIIFDCHAIPYQNESFDCVIAQAVLEHVINPQQCVQEIYRVLKPDGLIYVETPFMQQVHGGAYDFTRFTHSGHRSLLKNFNEIKSGATAGPGTVMLWSYEYLIVSVLGFSKSIILLLKAFARITGFWLKYIDFLCRWNPRANDAASGFYFIGKKSASIISDTELIQYYTNRKS